MGNRNPKFSAVWNTQFRVYFFLIIYTSDIFFDMLMCNPSGQCSNRSNQLSKWWTVQALQVHPGDQILAVNGVSGNWEEPWPSLMEIWEGTSRFYLFMYDLLIYLKNTCFLVFVIYRMRTS